MSNEITVHAIIRGKVQGIGFRVTARYCARQLGIKGTVRNLSDGSVEIYAQGTKPQIDQLFENIKREIGSNNIDCIQSESVSLQGYDSFKILT